MDGNSKYTIVPFKNQYGTIELMVCSTSFSRLPFRGASSGSQAITFLEVYVVFSYQDGPIHTS